MPDTQGTYHRRQVALPLLALVAALTVSGHSSWGQTKQAVGPGTLEGTWALTVTPTPGPGAPPPFQALVTFTSNGGFISTETDGPGVAQGSWVQTGDRTYNLTFVRLLFDSKGQLAATEKVWSAITVKEGFGAYTERAKVEFRDPTGKLLISGTASNQATRMPAEPLQ